ncbi:MAG: Methylglutaconyl-CoA hydratase [Ktedonobacterales bacterium]|nr:MAG: Methylglutaconyl-CoA hydratase [Ktedonobacterales bacterium]
METFETITCVVQGPVATVTLNRPEVRNALSNQMVTDLLRCFTTLASEEYEGVRAVVLRAAGSVFCAGGDVRDLSDFLSTEENRAAIAQLDALLRAVNQAPQVVIARAQGAALGGGLGLICVCDVAVAGESASFGLPEVRLGLVPAVISPYVVERVGLTRARQLMLTGARFDVAHALTYGLIHEACADEELDTHVAAVVGEVLRCGPQALRECKRLLFRVARDADTLDYRVELLDRLRASEEAQQGMLAFIAKQPAPWAVQS